MVSFWDVVPDDILMEMFIRVDPFSFLFTLKFVWRRWWLLFKSETIWEKYGEENFPLFECDRFPNAKERTIYYAEAFAFLLDISERQTTLGRYYADFDFNPKQRKINGKNLTPSRYLRSVKRKHLITDELKRYNFLKYDIFPKHVHFYVLVLIHMVSRLVSVPIRVSPIYLNIELFREIFNNVSLKVSKGRVTEPYLVYIRKYYQRNGKKAKLIPSLWFY